jgi:ATP-dependent DNA helicase RecG
VSEVAGVGPRRLALLQARGLATFLDVLRHLPRRYEDLRRRDRIAGLRAGMTAVIEGTLEKQQTRPMRGRGWRRLTTATLRDADGATLAVAWFNLHGDGRMPLGEAVLVCGRVTTGARGALELLQPEVYRLRTGSPPAIRPIYSLPPAIPQRLFSSIAAQACARAGRVQLDAIPDALRASTALPRVVEALAYLHQPPPDAERATLEACATPAHQALATDEMFTFQLALARDRARRLRRTGARLDAPPRLSAALVDVLPFALTAAQRRAMAEIDADLATPEQMNRVLIGDVGSGKTLVAFNGILRAVESGWQAVMMAPTELLAEQHFRNFNAVSAALGVSSALITNRVAGAERARLVRALGRGDIAVAFGTHALFQEGVKLHRLGFAVIDEQHRFGVLDRARLLALGAETNVLLMTATPIPRSLALTLLRSLAVSRLDEAPPGRTPVLTAIFSEDDAAEVERLVRSQLEEGRRAYYVLPLIEAEEDSEADKSVAAVAKQLTRRLGEFGVGVLHGRMRPAEKDRVMRQFRDGAINVLVATTVVEVGVDVPEATIIVIMAAERYGLAQLHQLRGRVGRGAAASRCCLVTSRAAGAVAQARLAALTRSSSGVEVAELDLRMRGPGDLFGLRQTGVLPLRFGAFIHDLNLIELAGDLAEEWLRRDPGLTSAESRRAVVAIDELIALGVSFGDIG